jgi:hypothetical protein
MRTRGTRRTVTECGEKPANLQVIQIALELMQIGISLVVGQSQALLEMSAVKHTTDPLRFRRQYPRQSTTTSKGWKTSFHTWTFILTVSCGW